MKSPFTDGTGRKICSNCEAAGLICSVRGENLRRNLLGREPCVKRAQFCPMLNLDKVDFLFSHSQSTLDTPWKTEGTISAGMEHSDTDILDRTDAGYNQLKKDEPSASDYQVPDNVMRNFKRMTI
ncbi:hypothetical protein K3495_g4161 [Podosphaera aphanis]|nr:hypothetical protein K3495_g4161 [Podosphaera aphanis]